MSTDATAPPWDRTHGFRSKPSSITSNSDSRYDVSWRYGVTEGGEALVRHVCGQVDDDHVWIEVKRKRRNDGKFYVELEHDPGRRGRFIPSGLSVTHADIWAFVIEDTANMHWTSTTVLKTAIERNYGFPAKETDGSCPTRGRLLSVFDLIGATKPGPASRAAFGDFRTDA